LISGAFLNDRQNLVLALTAAWTMAGVMLYLLAPQSGPVVLPLALVAPVALRIYAERRVPFYPASAVTKALLLAGAYLLINASWSLSPSTAYFNITALFIFIAVLHVTLNTLPDCEAPALRAMALGFLVGMAVAGCFLAFEAFSQQLIRRTLMTSFPVLRPDPRHMVLEAGRVVHLPPYLLNRNTAALAVLFWPAVLAAIYLARNARARTALLLGLVPVLAAIFRSAHATSKIAILGSAGAYGLYLLSPRIASRLVLTGWVAATLFVVPLALLAYASNLYLADWLAPSAQHRIVIWGYTGEQIAKAPVVGVGVNTARALYNPDDYDSPRAPGSAYQLSTSLHSHNVYLQTWYETGAVGAIFLFAIGLMIFKSVSNAPFDTRLALCATLVSCALLGSSSFSLWAPWFMASFGLAAVFATLGNALAAAGPDPPG